MVNNSNKINKTNNLFSLSPQIIEHKKYHDMVFQIQVLV
jgi:hypothetical protein